MQNFLNNSHDNFRPFCRSLLLTGLVRLMMILQRHVYIFWVLTFMFKFMVPYHWNCYIITCSNNCYLLSLHLNFLMDWPMQTELALHLCWAISEHGAGGINRTDVARELFENLELLLYENLGTRWGRSLLSLFSYLHGMTHDLTYFISCQVVWG
jgi:hypothetical protein